MMENNASLLIQAQKGDKKARDKLVEINMGLVHHIVKRFTNRGYDLQDLFQRREIITIMFSLPAMTQ